MLLTEVIIKNFRGIEDISLPLDDFCVLIGENNTGKSSVLDAIRICLTRPSAQQRFEEYDYHLKNLSNESSELEPIEITLRFSEDREDEWPNEISQRLSKVVQSNDNLNVVVLRVVGRFDPVTGVSDMDYSFIDLSGEAIPNTNINRDLAALRQLVPTHHLVSLRDAEKEFQSRSKFWKPFINTSDFDDETRNELETILSDLNKKVLEKHTEFDVVKKHLERIAELMPLGDTDIVSINALPSKIFDILSRVQVHFSAKSGIQIPVTRHGSGTQSLAVICLFDAFLQNQLELEKGYQHPLLALEEPETHLHPSAVKAVGKKLLNLPGQKLISTHSGDFLAGIPLQKIRRLRRTNGKISVHKIKDDSLMRDEIEKFNYQIRAMRGSLLFSKCWLLVEGETEAILIPECARAMGYDLYAEGVSCIEFSHVGVEKYIKLANQLGIEWFVLVDNDAEGTRYKRSASNQLDGRKEEDHIRLLDHGTMEVFLCMEGFGEIYKDNISNQNEDNIVAKPNTLDYWQQVTKNQGKSKPKNSLAVAEKINAGGAESIPRLLQEVIEQTRKLAQRAD